VVPVRISKTKTKLSRTKYKICQNLKQVVALYKKKKKTQLLDNDFSKGNQVNVHNVVLEKCVEFIYAVVSDSGKL
jgi:hypothetical protein